LQSNPRADFDLGLRDRADGMVDHDRN